MAAHKTPIKRVGNEAVVAVAAERDDAKSKGLYAKGAIVCIRLENFGTYDSLKIRPGPNLNVVIEQNCMGKLTILCAICFGMTDKPSVLGRASKFIKYGKNSGTIEIELNNTGGCNYVIRRVIYNDNKSDWFMNDKAVQLKDVEDLVNELNIQVGNLCQFLPQEKVAEIARMNPQELLENTEKVFGGLELHEKHIKLMKDITSHQINYEEIKREWLDQVTSMLDKINAKYAQLFDKLNCQGGVEVCLNVPENPDEFDKYGISIRVNFHANEQLHELRQQSGGEKSISAMFYMIALQEITQCPFRVVDEIQWMDSVNERKVFDIIVQNSLSAQYILLTSKHFKLNSDGKVNFATQIYIKLKLSRKKQKTT